jgi:hypothetical protein
VLPTAKKLLLSLLTETNAAATALPEHDSILSIRSFSRQNLAKFQLTRDHNIGEKWEQYNIRRKQGGPRELFSDREEAIWWLKQIAPVKYVDGAWLGHIGKVTTPFALRKTVKIVWQVLSEELGDGDLEKNHVHLYQKLLKTVAPTLPTPEALDFIHPRHGLNELAVWKSAIAQLLISLFPREFLPEILGFNLHFEAISLDTLKAASELKEVKIDPYYFILHISIDNADSGHTAIAMEVVCEYMEYIQRLEGDEAAQKVWERIQSGYLLSQGLPGTAICPSQRTMVGSGTDGSNPAELEVMRIFKAKARVAHKIHCRSRVKIGSRNLDEWLDPVACESDMWQKSLLSALSHSKYWICRGDSSRSRFVQELGWNGRMFGCFTQAETEILKNWIDDLPKISSDLENHATGPDIVISDNQNEDILCEYPVLRSSFDFTSFDVPLPSPTPIFTFRSLPSLNITNSPIMEKFLPLWIAHPCLLQSFISVPFRTSNKLGSTIVKILRAQMGFHIEQEYVAGMDEVRRPDSFGLLGIGINILAQQGLETLSTLKQLLEIYPSDFAIYLLHISMRPLEHKGLLIGIATAFVKMHCIMKKSSLLSGSDQLILEKIVCRELEGLEECWNELLLDSSEYNKCCKGYIIAREEIGKCFVQSLIV